MKKLAAVCGLLMLFGAAGCQQAMVRGGSDQPVLQPGAEPPAVMAHYLAGYETPSRSNRWRYWSWDQPPRRHNPDRMYPDGRRDIVGIHHPLIEPYDSTDEAVLEYHILLAKAAGLDGFVVDWYGFNDEFGQPRYEDQAFQKMLALAGRMDFKVCLNFEDKSMFPPFQRTANREASVALAKENVARACALNSQAPGYFTLDGRPVLTNYNWNFSAADNPQPGAFTVSEWKRILAGAKPSRPILISNVHWHWNRSLVDTRYAEAADSLYPWVGNSCKQLDRFYTEAEQLRTAGKLEFLSGLACPGFDNRGTSGGRGETRMIVPRKNGETYKNTWNETLKHKPRWIQILTWNDFANGSTIEPTREYEYQYLELTADFTSALRGRQPDYQALRVPKKIYDAKQELQALSRTREADQTVLSRLRKDAQESVALAAKGQARQAEALISQVLRRLSEERAKVPAAPAILVTLEPDKIKLRAGETKIFWVEVKNQTPQAVHGRIKLDSDRGLPNEWFNQSTMPVDLNPRQGTKLPFRIKVPEDAGNVTTLLEAQLYASKQFIRSRVASVEVITPFFKVDLGPRNLFLLNEEAEVRVALSSLQEDGGKVQLAVPGGWQVRPAEVEYVLEPDQPGEAVFWVKPATSQPGAMMAVIQSREQGQVKVQEPVQALRAGETVLLQGDLDNDGELDYVLGNRKVEVHVSCVRGGRLTGFFLRADGGGNQLYYDPAAGLQTTAASDQWIEYGGINDTFPLNWPGEVWNVRWPTKIIQAGPSKSLEQSVRLSNGLVLTRQLRLREDSQRLELTYVVQNQGPKPLRYRWHNHPDLAPGPSLEAQRTVRIQVPQSGGVANLAFSGNLTKEHFVPSQNWCLAWDSESDEYFLQQFDARRVEKIGVWQGKDFFTMEIISKEDTLESGESKRFRVDYIAGKGDWENQLPLFSNR